MVRDSTLLKQLQSQLEKVKGEKEAIRIEVVNKSKELALKQHQAHELERQIGELTNEDKPIVVSEHAIIRYLERVVGVNIEEIQKKIITEELTVQYRTVGNGEFPMKGFSVKVKDGVAVTVLTKERKENT